MLKSGNFSTLPEVTEVNLGIIVMEIPPNHPKPNKPDAEPAAPPTPIVYENEEFRWEYKKVQLNMDQQEILSEGRLNDLGKEGWELAAVLTRDKAAHYYFKRPATEN